MGNESIVQYCRYCSHALDYNGEAVDFVCTANAECGDYGAGRFYSANKAKARNRCKHFDFNPLDVFYTTYGEREYKPRKEKQPSGQIKLIEWIEEK